MRLIDYGRWILLGSPEITGHITFPIKGGTWYRVAHEADNFPPGYVGWAYEYHINGKIVASGLIPYGRDGRCVWEEINR